MRELKFRAWLDRFRKMSYKVCGDAIGCWFCVIEMPEDSAHIRRSETHVVYPNHGDTIEQYTGLKDKNGKEIYEGDIVELYGNSYAVKWSETSFSFIFASEAQLYWLSPSKELDCQVIGNIHENPELLSQKGA